MKKFLTVILSLALLAALSIPVFAAGAADWVAGNGFVSTGAANGTFPVTVRDTENGVQISHGGYYLTGDNWGGAAYNVPIKVDGASVEITLDKFPEGNNDCWFSVDFLEKPQLFFAGGDFAKNKGIANLIRFTNGIYQGWGPESWSGIGDTNDASFSLKQGDTITVSVKKVGSVYKVSLNGVECAAEYKADAIFPDGTGYLVISGSMIGVEAQDNYVYTVKTINGESTALPTEEPEDNSQAAAADNTADAGIAAVLVLAAAACAVVFRKKH